MATAFPRSLSVAYVVANLSIPESEAKQKDEEISDENVNQFLSDNGVVLQQNDSPADRKRAALALRANPQFWVKHYPAHPNVKRVKNWMWVHDRYRSQVDALVASANALPNFDKDKPSVLLSAAKKLLADYHKFVGKIEKHSEFEDQQLFKFFVDEKIGGGDGSPTSDALKNLMAEHADIKNVTDLQECLEKIVNGDASSEDVNVEDLKEDVKLKMTAYNDDLSKHLDEEERTIVALWLQLTPSQYKKYRSYLSWKYAMMY